MKIKVSEYIADFLVDNGINTCFMVTGGGAMHLDDAFGHKEGLKCIFNHHEQACAFAAEAYARMTGEIALVSVTSGPGGTNALTGVMGGWVDSIPMLVISGQIKRETSIASVPELGLRQLGDQEYNIVSSAAPMTKYAHMVMDEKEISYHLEKALFLAKDGRPGPVWLDIPLDIQGGMIETDELKHFDPKELEEEKASEVPEGFKVPGDEEIDALIKELKFKISMAKAPLVLAGTGINLARCTDKLLAFLDKYKIPVVTAWNANDTVSCDNPYYAGMPGTVGQRCGNFALQNCDLLISLGCRMNIRMIGYTHFDFAKNAYKAVVEIDPKELCKPTVKVDMPINMDVSKFLDKMNEGTYMEVPEHAEWARWCRNLVEKYPAVLPEYHTYDKNINPYVFIDTLFSHLKDDDRIICGNGSACVITFQAAKIKQGQRMFTNSGCASMGYGFPAAVGVAVSDNTRRTICIDGEGSFMMNLQELATVHKNKLNIKIFIINNNGYLSMRQTQTNLFKGRELVGVDNTSGIEFPNFALIALAFGLDYKKIEKEADADAIIDEVIGYEGACICEVCVDPAQNFEPKISSRVLSDGKIVSPTLSDMSPFLPRDEYEAVKYEG